MDEMDVLVDHFFFRMIRHGGIPIWLATFLLIASICLSSLWSARRVSLCFIIVAWYLSLLATTLGIVRAWYVMSSAHPGATLLFDVLYSDALAVPVLLLSLPAVYLALDRENAIFLSEHKIIIIAVLAGVLDLLLVSWFLAYVADNYMPP